MVLITRPPDTSILTFVEEIAGFMEYSFNLLGEVTTLGDINIHMNEVTHSDTTLVNDMLDS